MDFSIVITNYNNGKFISRAVRSCLGQIVNQKKVEVLVVDDASTDNSLEEVKEFENEIRLISLEKNYGVAYASNVGLKMSNGKYWMRVDADDYLSSHACEFMGKILDYNKKIAYVFSDHYRINISGFVQSRISISSNKMKYAHGAGILFRKTVLEKIGGYDNSLRNCEDYGLLYRIDSLGYKSFHLPVPLYRYYIHGKNMTLTEERSQFNQIVEEKNGIQNRECELL